MTAQTILPANTLSSGSYQVDNSLRFNDGSSDYLSRTPGSAGNQKLFTYSVWIKRSALGSNQNIFHEYPGSGQRSDIIFRSADTIRVSLEKSNSNQLLTNRVFRDISAWYHLVVVYDSDNDTAGNRVKLYVNGVRETSFATEQYPDSGSLSGINTTGQHEISSYDGSGDFFDGYMAENVLIDGQALDPTSFGEFDDSGIWKPINVSGLTFGTNGFYLEYKETGTSADASGIGADTSGNTHHFTVNNLTAVDQSIDTCTNNFCVMNPLDNLYGAATFAEGNLQVTTRNAGYSYNTATFGVASGKWYWEIKYSAQTTADSSTNQFMPGIAKSVAISSTDHMGYRNTSYAYQSGGNLFYNNGTTSSGYDAYGIGDIAGIALDIDNLRLYVSKNGTFQNSADPAGGSDGYTITAPDAVATDLGFYFPAFGDGNDNDIKVGQLNFGSPIHAISSGNTDGNGFGNFEYAVPSGFFALCTKNLAENG